MLANRVDRLRAYLMEGARLPFVWGVRDCISWPCGWVKQERGFDPHAAIRGAYDSGLSCARFLRRHGGLLALARRETAGAGFNETTEPEYGDVGIVSTAAGPMGAIRAGNAWALKSMDGLVLVPAHSVIAWKV